MVQLDDVVVESEPVQVSQPLIIAVTQKQELQKQAPTRICMLDINGNTEFPVHLDWTVQQLKEAISDHTGYDIPVNKMVLLDQNGKMEGDKPLSDYHVKRYGIFLTRDTSGDR